MIPHNVAQCTVCNSNLTGKQTKFCSRKCKMKKQSNSVYTNQQKRGWQRKIHLIKMFGSKCQLCGYNRCLRALTFHHTQPDKKTMSMDIRHLSGTKMERIYEEVKLCQLLCMNCHAELHHDEKNSTLSTLL